MRGQARPGRAAHEKCSRVLELAGASMAGDVEEGLSDPAPFSRRRMRSEGLHAVEGVDCGGLRRLFDRLFGDIDLSRSLYLTGDNSYCPDYPYYLVLTVLSG